PRSSKKHRASARDKRHRAGESQFERPSNARCGSGTGHVVPTSTGELAAVKLRFSNCTISIRMPREGRQARPILRCDATLTMLWLPSKTSAATSCGPNEMPVVEAKCGNQWPPSERPRATASTSERTRPRSQGSCRFDQKAEDRKSTRLNSSHVKISYAV